MTDNLLPIGDEVPAAAAPDELIVDLPHRDLVAAALPAHGFQVVDASDKDGRLGLARLKLRGTADINDVVESVRTEFHDRFGGWMPLMDTNRNVSNVIGSPETRPMHAMADVVPFPQTRPMHAVMPFPETKPMAGADPKPADGPGSIAFTPAGRGVRVGVLDTKISAHPDLIGRFIADPDAIYHPLPEPVPLRAGHATFVAYLIVRQAPAVTIDARAVLDDQEGQATAWDTACAMMGFADSGVDVLNLSLGCRTENGRPPLVFSRAVGLLSQRMVIVAAAGNHGGTPGLSDKPTWPAALPDVVAVGARDVNDNLAGFSPYLPWVTCTAPGDHVFGAYLGQSVQTAHNGILPFQGYATWSGTSFATATTSGAIAASITEDVDAHEAVTQLLAKTDGVVRPFMWQAPQSA